MPLDIPPSQVVRPTREEADSIVRDCVALLAQDQPELLDLDVSERALSHQLAIYLRERFSQTLAVDCEYNRHQAEPKRLMLPSRTALDYELSATTAFPDIIVHKRATDDFNILVLELKKPGQSSRHDEAMLHDKRKLCAFRRDLHYVHCGFLILGRNASGSLENNLTWMDDEDCERIDAADRESRGRVNGTG